jgi:hypothetical protein
MTHDQFTAILVQAGVRAKSVQEDLWKNFPGNRYRVEPVVLYQAARRLIAKCPAVGVPDATPNTSGLWTPGRGT